MRKPTTRREFLWLSSLGVTSAALLAACGGPAASPTAAPAKPAAEPTKPAAAPAPTTAPAAAPTSAYYKAAIDQLVFQGKLYALPFKLQPGQMGLYYNANALKEVGAKEPDLNLSMEDFANLTKALTKGPADRPDRFGYVPYFDAA